MIKTVQKTLCELPKANEPSRSDDLTRPSHSISSTDPDDDDDDCVYVSPDETENGIFSSSFSQTFEQNS